ncbi:MAG: penicillin-binding transpeptidase domain-containing protein, partial [Clostridium sp.]|uniref:penicillin-binding transpeptidase domain-containing protein n=1 Tax=Clostridium sp. TaxID=1506 RepID=UPI003F3115FB
NLDGMEATEGSLDYMIKSEIENNEFPKVNFYRDDNTVYTNKKLVQNEKNKNIKLTVDKELQTKIKKVTLDKKYEKYENIGVILLESKNGKIRSLTQKDESEANINLGMEGIGYEPGSIFKLITYGIALEEGVITPETAYTCRGKKCKNVFHGNISSKKALVESCNDIFGYIGGELGSEVVLDYSRKLGMFERVLNIDSKNKSEAKGTYMKEDAGVDNLAIGQSMTVTPIQITGAINTFVNDGIYIKPSIVEGITDSEGNVIQEMKSESKMIFSKLTSDMVKDGMKDVVLYGTGELAKVNGKEVYGKTGSGTFQNETHCWFTGAFEIDGVKYTMSVVVPNVEEEKGKVVGGSTVAAPIFSDIVKELEK